MVPILEKENFKRSILQRLVYSVGKDTEHAVPRDWCVAVTLVVRDRLMDPWLSTMRRIKETDAKRVYYLSMEFLIGRLLGDTMLNLGMVDLCRAALADLNIDLDEILEEEPDAALGNGGLGRLAACFMESMATLGCPAYGYGIRYEHGLFSVAIDSMKQAASRPRPPLPRAASGSSSITARMSWPRAAIASLAAS